MRYSSDHKAATRQHLLGSAGALAKEKGYGTTGVDALMSAAGLTAGAFYAHFGSKAGMLEALIAHEMSASLRSFDLHAAESFAVAVEAYLSPAHVEHPERGCVVPALAAEVARAEAPVRETFERHLLQMKDRYAAQVGGDGPAWVILAQLVGAVLLARAMQSSAAREALLDGVRSSILGAAGRQSARPKARTRRKV